MSRLQKQNAYNLSINRRQTSKVTMDSRQVKLAVGHQEMNYKIMFDG